MARYHTWVHADASRCIAKRNLSDVMPDDTKEFNKYA
jgi:hypothetical protein